MIRSISLHLNHNQSINNSSRLISGGTQSICLHKPNNNSRQDTYKTYTLNQRVSSPINKQGSSNLNKLRQMDLATDTPIIHTCNPINSLLNKPAPHTPPPPPTAPYPLILPPTPT